MKESPVIRAAALCGWLLVASAIAAGQAGSAPTPVSALDRPALLVIDIQNFYFEGGRLSLVGSVEASLKAGALLEAFRAEKRPVIHIQHLPLGIDKFEPGVTDEQYAIHPNVVPSSGETILVKHFANSFRDTNLAAILKDLNIKTLVIAGMQTHMCVEAAVRAGADLGFDIVLVEDACATRDLKHGDTVVAAASVQAAVLAALDRSYAKVVKTVFLLGAAQAK